MAVVRQPNLSQTIRTLRSTNDLSPTVREISIGNWILSEKDGNLIATNQITGKQTIVATG